MAHHQAGRLEQAAAAYRAVLEREPQNIDALHFLGVVAFQQKRHAEAERLIRAALALNPANAPAQNNLANALFAQDRLEEAIAAYRRAVELDPTYADARSNLAAAYNNLGNAHQALGELPAAEESYRRALALKPDYAAAKVNLGFNRLLLADYVAGLPLLESRFAALGRVPFDPALRWQGEEAIGKKLLVWSEQGLGDSIMMARYLPLLAQRGFSTVVLYTQPALVRLLGGVSNQEPAPKFDLHCPIMSLPLLFGTRLETIPAKVPYLQVPQSHFLSKGRNVGLCWAGTRENRKNAVRSIRLEQLAPLFAVPGVSFVSLQKGDGAEELAAVPWKITNWMNACEDLLDTAALIGELDLVITVDTAIAHLAGALGKPVWMLNRFESEWRWMLGREDSPWYPTMRLFRQPAPGDWQTPIARIAQCI